MEIERHRLVRLGTVYVVTTASGARIGVVRRHDEWFELLLYSTDDPRAAPHGLPLTVDEARALSALLAPNLTTPVRITEERLPLRAGHSRTATDRVRQGPPRRTR
ncbi:hypothetical protein Ais01nite_20810 [Asanoa ishikariensis]|uniref:Potassium/proton antiporter subunit KhtT-like N-terminal domain-containing protein n=1 Tax=Asanoa ishikariensis TaxID=137265 RepID=A0A1H3U8Y4_9ACTN|nr:hypothetical protein [Asanoa ishikariensis]GIF64046.1 hypothetical protein Ais01nite_20810 [Asanoa ishikariensis]SDZ58923.1 hypothetical protein SAMN05421684_6793 [Asanoa ishikariensis]